MEDKIKCPHCLRFNEIHKFCVYCGKPLPFDDEEIKLMLHKPDATCLNCARPVKKGQSRCVCGYELADIECPECGVKNHYTNKFCTVCRNKLWSSYVEDYKFDNDDLSKRHIFSNNFPHALRNTSLNKRYSIHSGLNFPGDFTKMGTTLEGILSDVAKINDGICEIRSRWKVVSPHYCINCLSVINPDEYVCPKCGYDFSEDKKRVYMIKNTKDNYSEPVFDKAELKWTSKLSEYYVRSLIPSIGESQLEYRQRLKWAFEETCYILNFIQGKLYYLKSFEDANKRHGDSDTYYYE